MEPLEQTIDLRDLIWRLRRYAWLIALPIVVCLCGAAVYYKLSVPLYESEILVAVDETQMSPALEPLVRADRGSSDPRERLAAVYSKIHSRIFLTALVDRIGMNKDPERLARAGRAVQGRGVTAEDYLMRSSINQLSAKIAVSPGRSSLISIGVSDADPEFARKLAETIGDLLIDESRHSTLANIVSRRQFSNDQITVYEDRLANAEDSLRRFQESRIRRGYDSSGVINEQNLSTAQGLQRASDGEMEQLRSRIQTARNEWRASVGDIPIPALTSPSVSDWTSQLGKLEMNAAMALLRGGTESRGESEALQARIASGRQSLFAELDQLAQALPADYSAGARTAAVAMALDGAVLQSLGERRNRLASVVATYLSRVEGSPRDEMHLRRLTDNVQTSRELLATLRKEATSSQISEALATSDLGPRLDIVEHPLLPLSPYSPEPLKIFGVAALLGVLIAGAIVFAGERLIAVVRTLEQAEAEYGLRVIGTIPRIEGWSRPGNYLRNHWAALALLLVLLLTGLIFVVDAGRPSHQSTTSQALGIQQ